MILRLSILLLIVGCGTGKAGGEDNIIVVSISNERTIKFYKIYGYRTDSDLLL